MTGSRTLLPAVTMALLAAVSAPACSPTEPPAPPPAGEIEVEVSRVAIDARSGTPVVVLAETGGVRELPIWIGFAEARSIAAEMGGHPAPRPNTHDLAKRLVDALRGDVERVVVTELRNGTYYAVLVLRSDGASREVDSRPSDAIALGLRYQAPLFVRESLLESASEMPEPDADERAI